MNLLTNFFAFALLLTSVQLHSQKFIDEDNVWIIKRLYTDENGDNQSYTNSFQFSGIEIIDSFEYHKIVVIAVDSTMELDTTIAWLGIAEAGKYFRTEGNRTYFKIEADGPEFLLHDFVLLWKGRSFV